jgi:hypothetical protein
MSDLPSFGDAVRLLALRAARNPDDWNAVYRRICRWYSTTFHTPLHEVFDLDEVFVLQSYYESYFEKMEEEEWRKEVREALETPDEKQAREASEAMEDFELLRKAAQDLERLEARRKKEPKTMTAVHEEAMKDFANTAEKLKSALSGLPGAIEAAKRPGERIKPKLFETEDPGEVTLGEDFPQKDEEMVLRAPKKSKPRQS